MSQCNATGNKNPLHRPSQQGSCLPHQHSSSQEQQSFSFLFSLDSKKDGSTGELEPFSGHSQWILPAGWYNCETEQKKGPVVLFGISFSCNSCYRPTEGQLGLAPLTLMTQFSAKQCLQGDLFWGEFGAHRDVLQNLGFKAESTRA